MSIFLSCSECSKATKRQKQPWPHYGNSPLHEASFRSLLTHAPGLLRPCPVLAQSRLRQVSHDVRFRPQHWSGAICPVRAFGH
jgi:hypothetical protein